MAYWYAGGRPVLRLARAAQIPPETQSLATVLAGSKNQFGLSAKFARGASYGSLVRMLFALFRRIVFQSRGTLLRISSPGIATKVIFACLFGHSSISVSCRDLTMNRSQPFGLAGSDCLDLRW